MFISFILFLFFMVILGVTLATLLTINRWYTYSAFPIIVAIFCFCSFTFGVIFGATLFRWFPLLFVRTIIILFCLSLVFFFYQRFHPSYGYIPYRGMMHWSLLGLFFFFIGVDFSIIGLSPWLLLVLLPIFALSFFCGTFLVWKLNVSRSFSRFVVYIPLLLFLFLAIVKLL